MRPGGYRPSKRSSSGVVRLDASKAAISGVQVTLIRVDTGDHREAVSSAEGYYDFPLLIPGMYSVTANIGNAIPMQALVYKFLEKTGS